MEEDAVLFSINAIRAMEVIDVNTGAKLGCVRDFKIDVDEQRVVAITIPSPAKTWFGKDGDVEIPWEKVNKIGIDVILIDGSDIDLNLEENNN